jgi:hypothetical protein
MASCSSICRGSKWPASSTRAPVRLAEAVELAGDEVLGVAGEHERVLAVLAVPAAVEAFAPCAGDLVEEPLQGGLLPRATGPPGRIDAVGPAVGLHAIELAHAFDSSVIRPDTSPLRWCPLTAEVKHGHRRLVASRFVSSKFQ